jgi:copper chaperone NosL
MNGPGRSGWLAAALALALASPPVRAGDADPVVPGPDEKCPVCGMFVARTPDWLAGVGFADGAHAFFDGAKDLFRYLLEDGRDGRGHTAGDVRSAFVTDYYSLQRVDAREAWFVLGSDVLGPMGRELVPFADERAAKEFLSDHRGRRILRFVEITPGVLKELE